MKHRLKIGRKFISLKVEEEIKYGFNKGKEVIKTPLVEISR